VNVNNGTVVEVNIADPTQQTVIANHGSRGDFVTVDPYDGSVFVTQTDRLVRLTFPPGDSPTRNSPPKVRFSVGNMAGASIRTDTGLGNSPVLALPPTQSVGENIVLPIEQEVLSGSNVGLVLPSSAQNALDTLFAMHQKGSQSMDPQYWDALDLTLILR
jgi:hypothetical protein